MGLGCLGAEQDVAAEAHGPALVGVHASHAKAVTRGAAGPCGLCRPVPFEDGVKEEFAGNGIRLNSVRWRAGSHRQL